LELVQQRVRDSRAEAPAEAELERVIVAIVKRGS